MALANRTDLLAAVASWLNRSDLTDRIPDFITLAESRLNRELRLRVMETEASLSVAVDGTSVALPSGFLEPIGLWSLESAERRQLLYMASVQMENLTSAGKVFYWTITGTNIVFERPTSPALSLILRYLASFALTEAAPTNWLLTNHPDAYLFATLAEAGPYLRDNELLAIFESRLAKAIDEINAKESRSRNLTILDTGLAVLPSDSNRRNYGGYGTYG